MYAKSIIEQRLDLAAKELGWKPERHSLEEVDKFIAHLQQWEEKDESGNVNFTRNLTQQEYRFIVNERTLCTCDALYFLTHYAYLSDQHNTKVRFKPRHTQNIYTSVIADLEEIGRAIELLVGKGRQQYVTTITELYITHRICFYRDVTCFTASADRDRSAEMMQKVLFTYDNLPWWLKPKSSRRVENIPGMLEFDGINSRMRVTHGSGTAKAKGAQKVGIARGTTPTVYHLSEISSFPDAREQIDAAILKSVHNSHKVFGVLESTFAGDTGYFPDKYRFAVEQLRTGGVSRFYPLFFSWPCNQELNPTRNWIRTNPVPYNWQPEGQIAEQILKAELFIRNSFLLSKYFGKDWDMPLDQQWWYHTQYVEHERTGALSTLKQEMPCDDVESMQSSYDNVFGRETINISHTNRDRDFKVYSIVGTAIDSKFDPDPDDIDYNKERILLTHTARLDEHVYKWELIPLKSSIFDDLEDAKNKSEDKRNEIIKSLLPLAEGKLFVYPKAFGRDTQETSLGIDSSNGIAQDSSVISGATKGTHLTPDIQMCEFRSPDVNHVQVFAFAMAIALYMKSFNKNENEINRWPMCGIEQIAAIGDTCQVQLRRMGYPLGRFPRFGRYDGVDLNKKSKARVGWYTVKWSRDLLIGYYVHAVRNGWYKLNSPWTIDECRSFEIHYTTTGTEKMEHSSTGHDDGLFASAISTFINHDLDTLAERGNKKLLPQEDDDIDIDLAPMRGMRFNPNDSAILSLADVLRDNSGFDRFRL